MTHQTPLFRIIAGSALAVAVLTAGVATRAPAQSAVFDPDATLRTFHERVESYVALHRRLAPPPADITGAAPLAKLLTRQYLASAIRSERRYANPGDVFTPAVATVFRSLLADSIGERDGEMFLAAISGGEVIPYGIHPTIDEPYSMTRVFRMPSDVRLGLPSLPVELDYRITAHDLLLWDIYAGIVVDFVPDAFRSPVVTEE